MPMSSSQVGSGRLRAYIEFLAALVYFFIARALAYSAALGLARDQWIQEPWMPLVEQAMLVFLLVIGYACMGFALDHQEHPLRAQGLPRREGWPGEAGLGLAAGWALAVVCVLPLVVGGGIAIVLLLQPSAWGWLLADAAFFALAALAEEVAFRGYGFQRFAHAVGPFGAVLGFAAFYAIVQTFLPGSSRASIAVSVVFSVLLSAAYLRTHALWVSWGINFGWKASRALLFGLAIGGVSSHSPVVQGNPMGPFWLTGGGYGLDGSWVACLLLLAVLPVVYCLTRDLNHRYNGSEIVAVGVPVDLAAVACQEHEAAMGMAESAEPPLVQVFPTATQPPDNPVLPSATESPDSN
jgi:membrane protease YdiL (CAAX protease family)